MQCPECQHENQASAKFCTRCRARLQVSCAHCGAAVGQGDAFCSQCGAVQEAGAAEDQPAALASLEQHFTALLESMPASLSKQLLAQAEAENCLVTILFADASEATRQLADLPPAEAAARLKNLVGSMVDALVRYEGRIDCVLGDSLRAVFGVPHARESDAERAVRAALEMREGAEKLGVSIAVGLNTGEVYIGSLAAAGPGRSGMLGHVVNLAARVQRAALPGQVLVAEATHRQTSRLFSFTRLPVSLRDLEGSTVTYAVGAPLSVSEMTPGVRGLRAELVGREEETSALRDRLGELLDGRGGVVIITGDAGCGKTRLVDEVRRQALAPRADTGREGEAEPSAEPEDKLLWLEGRGDELRTGEPWGVFRGVLRSAFASSAAASGISEWLEACLQELVDGGHLAAGDRDRMAPHLQVLAASAGASGGVGEPSAPLGQRLHQTAQALRGFLGALAQQRPTVLALDDLQWADALSLDLVPELMETAQAAPLLLLGVCRSEAESEWSRVATARCPNRCLVLRLRGLSPSESMRMIASLLTIESLPESVRADLAARTAGNPLFIEEAVRLLIDAGAIYQEGLIWRPGPSLDSLTLPEVPQDIPLSRADRVDRGLRSVLDAAAALGPRFRPRMLEALTGGMVDLRQALWELEDRGFLCLEAPNPEEEYAFRHTAVREVLYQRIPAHRRAVLHQKAGESLEAASRRSPAPCYELLAYHYERSRASAKAVEYLTYLADQSREVGLTETARRCYEKALSLATELSGSRPGLVTWQMKAHQGLGRLFHATRWAVEAEEHLREALAIGLETGVPAEELVRLLALLADALQWQGKYDEMLRAAEEGLVLIGAHTQSAEAALLNAAVAMAYLGQGRRGRFHECCLRNQELLEALPYADELRPAYAQVVAMHAFHDRDPEAARRWACLLARRAHGVNDLRGVGEALYSEGHLVLFRSGRLREALEPLRRAAEVFGEIGERKLWGWSLGAVSRSHAYLGELEPAAEVARRRVEAVLRGAAPDAAEAHLGLGAVLLAQERLEDAARELAEAARTARDSGQRLTETWAMLALGQAQLALGSEETAQDSFERAASLAGSHRPALAFAVRGMEATTASPQDLEAWSRRFLEEHRDTVGTLGAEPAGLLQLRLAPDSPLETPGTSEPGGWAEGRPLAGDSLPEPWIWRDPFGDCAFQVAGGLELRAANGRDLFELNLSAPRAVRPTAGDLAVQCLCEPVDDETPAIGGLLLWQDRDTYLRLDLGTRGADEVSVSGCIDGVDLLLGRGRLEGPGRWLRLERVAGMVKALCSADGRRWLTVAQTAFTTTGPVEVGVFASGLIDRTVYRGAHPSGTAIRFDAFDLWRLEPVPQRHAP